MHGVGKDVLLAAFARAGFPAPALVTEQADPDPDFPTVAFPNPEEPGAMDLAFATARETAPDLIIANDPDADRCAVAVRDVDGDGGGDTDWRMLRGDEVGALLAAHLVHRGATGTFAESIVSSSLLGRIAEKAGLPTSRPSPASSGSPAPRACATATRRPSATAWTPTAYATRTASRPPS